MTRRIALTVMLLSFFIFEAFSQNSGTLQGRVSDKKTGEPLPFANVVLLQGGNERGVGVTDMDGYYTIKPLDPGKYQINISYVGYTSIQVNDFIVTSGKITRYNAKMSMGIDIKEIEVIDYKKPLVDADETTTGQTLTAEEIKKAPTRSISELANLTAGMQGGSVKGQRTSGTVYYVDGVRVRGNLGVSNGSLAEVNTLTGGVPAQYGDLVGGVVSITTKGPAAKFNGGLDIVTSQFLDPYGYNTADLFFSGPLLLKDKRARGTDTAQARIGFSVGGSFNYRKDPYPSPIKLWKVKDSKLEEVEANPLLQNPNGLGFIKAAELITREDMEQTKFHDLIPYMSYNLNGKLDFRINDNVNLVLGGVYSYYKQHGFNEYHSLFNYKYAAKSLTSGNNYRAYLRFTQKFANKKDEQTEDEDSPKKSKTSIKNAYYSVMASYEKISSLVRHEDFNDEYFKYGHVGKFERYQAPYYVIKEDTVRDAQGNIKIQKANFMRFAGTDTNVIFQQADYNTYTGNYTSSIFNLLKNGVSYFNYIPAYGGLINGGTPDNVYSLWANVGQPSYSYSKSDREQFRLNAIGSADIGNHEIKFGLEYEQYTARGYSVAATGIWTVMRQLMNSHIMQLDESNPIPVYHDGIFADTVNYLRFNDGSQSTFDKKFRDYLIAKGAKDVYGKKIDELSYINVDRYDPGEFKLEYFSPEELLQNGLVNYYGFDYLGNKNNSKPGIDDFLESDEKLIAPYNPIYMAAFIQDKFSFKDMIFRVGLRVDRYDANTFTLKDKYSMYPTRKTSAVSTLNGEQITHPGNIGGDYVVYVDDPFKPTEIVGYRNGDDWYNAAGSFIVDPNVLALETETGRIAPYLVESDEKNLRITKDAFTDYQPELMWSPRISFSFPISEEANFFANYDILVQRPDAGSFATIDDYYYLEERGTSSLANAALKPQQKTSYEIGFKQKIASNMAITLQAYYGETRNQINARMLFQAYPRDYLTFDNIDFQTVKGMTVAYDLRRKANTNAQMQLNYTLQFADGTGSSATSQAALVNTGQPNLRTPFPLSNDIRHAFSLSFDWRYFQGSRYNGPVSKEGKQILKNTGLNIMAVANSGRPYSKQSNVTQAVGVGIRQSAVAKGTLNGSRYPWNFNVNIKIDRTFILKTGKKETIDGKEERTGRPVFLNVYVWVSNLFDIRNVGYLYRYTGQPDDDGWLSSPEGQKTMSQAVSPQAYYDQYATRVNSQFNYSYPRFIRLGVSIGF